MAELSSLERLRRQIDRLDGEIVRLLNERAGVALEIGQAKADERAPIFAPAREAEVLQHVDEASAGPLRAEHLRAIYREILSACRDLQRPIRVAYFGPAATFTHMAALERFGQAPTFLPVASIAEVFAQVQKDEADFGVVPAENSTEGPVRETLDLLIDSELKICSAVTLPVVHCLLANVPLDEIRAVYSHPQALAQCRRWLAENLPGREVVPALSTARAAELAARDPHGAAIATRLASETYGVRVVEAGIQDLAHNSTRFFVVSRAAEGRPTGRDKTAILFSVKDRVGALRDVVEVFASAAINLSSIQSRPSRRRAWDYVFFAELEGHGAEERVRTALAQVEQHAVFLKVLGSWPVE
ncbi:MAG: prephenate dehydratase [Chloroflexi bacterium]|nr:prephenate dehydratase [Chloroflexota bacterium]